LDIPYTAEVIGVSKIFLSYWEYTLNGTLCGYAKINLLVLEANVWVSKKPLSFEIVI